MNFKAFTILEMIINLALMSIIVGMVYVVYGYFSKSMTEYSVMTTENFELEAFNIRLKEDFYNADRILFVNQKNFKIIFYNETYMEYEHVAPYLFRNAGRAKDSIRISQMNISYLEDTFPEKNEILIKNIFIEAELYGSYAPLYAYKDYYSNYLNKRGEH